MGSPTTAELIAAIQQRWEPTSQRCGRLVQSRRLVWHYSVALSNAWAIAWGPEGGNRPAGDGCLTIHELTPEFIDAHSVAYLPQSDIYDNLLASVIAFPWPRALRCTGLELRALGSPCCCGRSDVLSDPRSARFIPYPPPSQGRRVSPCGAQKAARIMSHFAQTPNPYVRCQV